MSQCCPSHHHAEPDHVHISWQKNLLLAGLCGVLGAVGLIIEKTQGMALPFYLGAYLAGGLFPAIEVAHLLRKKILDVHLLMIAVAVGAAIIGHWWEGAVLLFLFSLSDALESLAGDRTEKEISQLFKASPKKAWVIQEGTEVQLPVESITAGMVLRVKPGDQFPVDVRVIEGDTEIEEAHLTGEALPVAKAVGDVIYSGSMNTWGTVKAEVLRPVSESAVAKVMNLIRQARENKAPSQRFTDRFGTPYTLFVLGGSLLAFLFFWLVLGLEPFERTEEKQSALYRAMTLMVVASPCALVLSIPSAILAAIASGARHGVLFRGGAAIEQLPGITRVALDKTGTLTTGELSIASIDLLGEGSEENAFLGALSLASHSTHPVSRALVREGIRRNLSAQKVTQFKSHSGKGVEGIVDGLGTVFLGRRSYMEASEELSSIPLPEAGQSEVFVKMPQGIARFLLTDEVRKASKQVLSELHQQGVKTVMLTGDREASAKHIATEVGVQDYLSQLHPEEKVAAVQNWVNQGERVAMVGDGVNDAPALAAATVSIGMGLRGSDATLEESDIILTKDTLDSVLFAFRLSKKARSIIAQNILLSLGTVVVLVSFAIMGEIPLTLGVMGHEGSTVLVVLNSLRLLFNK